MSNAARRLEPTAFVSHYEDHPSTVFDANWALKKPYASYSVERGKRQQKPASSAAVLPPHGDFSELERAFFAAGDAISDENLAAAAEVERPETPRSSPSARRVSARRVVVV